MIDFHRRKERLTRLENKSRTKLETTQNARVAIAVLFFIALVLSASRVVRGIEIPSVLVFSFVFTALVWRSRKLSAFAFRLKKLNEFYERQARRQKGLAVQRPWAKALDSLSSRSDRAAVSDLNLIGEHSLFTLVDETFSDGGRKELVGWMTEPPLSETEIKQRQALVRDLKNHRWLFVRLVIAAEETELELSSQQALEFLRNPFLPRQATRLIVGLIFVWLICMSGVAWNVTQGKPWASAWFMAFLFAGFYVSNQIGPVFKKGVGLANHLSALMTLFNRIEKAPLSNALQSLLPKTLATRPSKQLKRFNFILAFLSAESHPLVYILINSIFPWAPVFSWLLERERKAIDKTFPGCLEELHRLEALASLCFVYIYQTQNFPEVSERPRLETKNMIHPLITRDQVVANDFSFAGGEVRGQSLGLLTGSNMSGKSTFLRTIGVNQVLANMGAPVFADSFKTTRFRIGSCIQISDSLRDGFSYFYAEVLRLVELVDLIKAGSPVLYLIDEIFRGTNNRERQVGSRAVIRSLVHSNSMGFVSTHDLELTSLAEELREVINLHFRDEIDAKGEMVFTYKLQSGPSPTTNALKIMAAAGLDLSSENR